MCVVEVLAGVSLFSLGWSVASYGYSLRKAYHSDYKQNLSAFVTQFFAHSLLTAVRVVALVAFASVFQIWLFVFLGNHKYANFPISSSSVLQLAFILGVHWLVMTVWIVSQHTDFCENKLQELVFDCIVGVIYCFNFFNLKEGKTRWRACVFYVIVFFENAALLCVWFLDSRMDLFLKIAALIAIFTAFVFGKL